MTKPAPQPAMTNFSDAYVRALAANAYTHQGTATMPLEIFGKRLQWDEMVRTDIKGMALIGEGDEYQHYVLEKSRVQTSVGKHGERVFDVAYGQMRSRYVRPNRRKFIVKADDWLVLTPNNEADFIVTRSVETPDQVQVVVVRGVLAARTIIAAKDSEKNQKKDSGEDDYDLSYQAQLVHTAGVYQKLDPDTETIFISAGMKVVIYRQKATNDRAPVIAQYNELALIMERTTPEYFVYQGGKEWMDESTDVLMQRDLVDSLHPRIAFVQPEIQTNYKRDQVVALAERAILTKDFVAALEILAPFAKEAPKKDGTLCFLAAQAYQGIKKHSLANKLYMRALELDENLLDRVYYHLGIMALENKRYKEAVSLFSKLGDVAPVWRQVSDYYRGIAYLSLGQDYMGRVALKDSLWNGHEKVLVEAAQDQLNQLEKERKRWWHLSLQMASDSNVFRLASDREPPEGVPHRSTVAYRVGLDVQHFVFQKDASSVAFEAGVVFDYYALQQIAALDLNLGLAVVFEPVNSTVVKVKPFIETIRISGVGVDGFGLESKATFNKAHGKPEVNFATAQFFDIANGQMILIDPYSREYTESEMVAARYNKVSGGFAPFRMDAGQDLRFSLSYAAYHRRTAVAQKDNFNKLAASSDYTYMWDRNVALKTDFELAQRDFPNSPVHRKDQGIYIKQDADMRLNASIHADLFGELLHNGSTVHDAIFDQNRLGCGVSADF